MSDAAAVTALTFATGEIGITSRIHLGEHVSELVRSWNPCAIYEMTFFIFAMKIPWKITSDYPIVGIGYYGEFENWIKM